MTSDPDGFLADVRERGDPNYVDANGVPALCYAIHQFRSFSLVRTLLKDGADVNKYTSFTPAGESQYRITGDAQRGLRTPNRYRHLGNVTPLHIAVALKQCEILRLLLENGADPNSRTSKDIGPLEMIFSTKKRSSHAKQLEMFNLLLEAGCNLNGVNEHGETVLHKSTVLEYTRLLLENNANPNAQSNSGQTPLHFSLDSIERSRLLLEHGANPNIQCGLGRTVYHDLVTELRGRNGTRKQFVRLLHQYNSDPNIRDNEGSTALHISVQLMSETKEDVQLVETILSCGADPGVEDNFGRTPAFYFGVPFLFEQPLVFHPPSLSKLLQPGISAKADPSCGCFLHNLTSWFLLSGRDSSASVTFERIISCFVGAPQADIDVLDSQQRTALHLVSGNGRWDLAEVLLKYGADTNIQDYDGNKPLDIAIKCEVKEFASDLLRWIFFESGNQKSCKSDGNQPLRSPVKRLQRSQSMPNLEWKSKFFSASGYSYVIIDYLAFDKEQDPVLTAGSTISKNEFRPTYINDSCPSITSMFFRRIEATSLSEACKQNCMAEFHLTGNCHEEKCLIAKQVFRLVTELVKKCEEMDPRMKCNVIATGSAAEGTKLWLPDEFDFMIELTQFKDQCELRGDLYTTEVLLKKECQLLWSDLLLERNCAQLSSEKLRNHVESLLRKGSFSLDKSGYSGIEIEVCDYDGRTNFIEQTKVGVKLAFYWISEKYQRRILINVDLTPTIPLRLPEEHTPELHRHAMDKWNSLECHVLPHCESIDCERDCDPEGKTDEEKDQFGPWRISYSLAELTLIRSMSEKQINVYRCLKLLRDICPRNHPPSYVLKCFFFNFIFLGDYIDTESFKDIMVRSLHLLRSNDTRYFSWLEQQRDVKHFFLRRLSLPFSYDSWVSTSLEFLDGCE